MQSLKLVGRAGLAGSIALIAALPVMAQDACLGTAEALHLTDEQAADVRSRGLTLAF